MGFLEMLTSHPKGIFENSIVICKVALILQQKQQRKQHPNNCFMISMMMSSIKSATYFPEKLSIPQTYQSTLTLKHLRCLHKMHLDSLQCICKNVPTQQIPILSHTTNTLYVKQTALEYLAHIYPADVTTCFAKVLTPGFVANFRLILK